MQKYYIENRQIKLNRYAVLYDEMCFSSKLETKVKVIQYSESELELEQLKQSLVMKNIPYRIETLDISDIEKFEGLFVNSEEEARKLIEPTIDELKLDKINEIKDACEQNIFIGVDVELSDNSTKHFSLKTEDQRNLNNLMIQLMQRNVDALDSVYYHADGELCTQFSKEDFIKIFQASSDYMTQNRNHCNYLINYVKTLTDKAEIINIKYKTEIPESYMTYIQEHLNI